MPRAEQARDARAEAQAVLGDALEARVLEPSPPAVAEAPWFADDPVDAAGAARPVVSPVAGRGSTTWDEWLAAHPGWREWAAARRLGAHRPLGPAPDALEAARLALHRLAAYVLSPARRRATGRIGLRWTLGGIGTPFFGAGEQVRIDGADLVRQRGGEALREPVTTLAAAAAFVLDGPPDLEWARGFDVPPAGDPGAPLGLDAGAAGWLGDWFGFAWSVLEELRADVASADASRVQLWPEHFDAAFDCLPPGRASRATFGASPGDRHHPEPYLYVLPGDDAPGPPEAWNAQGFTGAVMTLAELAPARDQRAAALAFLRERRALLTA